MLEEEEEESHTIKYTWQLENFCFCDFYCNMQLKSEEFTVNSPVYSKWYLYMFPNGCGIDKHVAIFLKRCEEDKGPEEIRVRFKISLLDNDGNLCPETPAIEQKFTKGSEFGHNEFIKRSDLITGCPFLYQDTLTVICQITVIHPLFSGRIPPRILSLKPDVMDDSKGVYRALKLLYENKLHSDISLKSKSEPFSVHKCVLRARLPDMFRTLMNNPDTIFTEDSFTEKILRYAYTGRFNFKDVNPFNIEKSLDEYGLLHLKKDLIPQTDEYLAQTYFPIQKCFLSWKIFTPVLKEENEIHSCFISNSMKDTFFQIRLEKIESGEFILHIKAIKFDNDDIFVRCSISVTDPNCTTAKCTPATYENTYTSNKFWKSPFTIRLENDTLTFKDLPNCLIKNDFFYLNFEFIYSKGEELRSILQENTYDTSFKDCDINDSGKLLSDFEDLYYKQYESDTIILVGKREFKVHKCILCARSPVFQAMFTHDMKEKENNKVHLRHDQLDDKSFADIVDKLLFTYCGKFEATSPEFENHLRSTIQMYMIGETYEDI